MSETTYDRKTIRYHWASAALILALWLIGQTADFVPSGPLRSAVWSTHFTLGGVVAALWIGGLLWRSSGGRQLPAAGSKSYARLTAALHGLLYAGVGGVVALGVLAACANGSVLWGFFAYPKLIGGDMFEPIARTHEVTANLLLLLGLAHGLMAVVRHFALRDGVLARMWPSLARR